MLLQPGGLFRDEAVMKAVNENAVAVELAVANLDADAARFYRLRSNQASNLLLVAPDGKLLYEDEGAVTSAMTPRRFVALLQETAGKLPPQEQEPRKSEPRKAEAGKSEAGKSEAGGLKQALRATLARGGMVLAGTLERSSPFAGMGFFRPGLQGRIEVKRDRRGAALIVVTGAKGKLEVWRKRGKTTQRFTWTGEEQPAPGSVATEVLKLTDLEALAGAVRKLREAGVEEIGGVVCRRYEAELPVSFVHAPQQPMGMALANRKLSAVFWVREDEKTLWRLRVSITKGLPANMQVRTAGGGPGKIEFGALYRFDLKAIDPQLEVAAPEAMR